MGFADLKIIGILHGQHPGFTKFSCFLCLWDSGACETHWSKREWPARITMNPVKKM